MFPVCILKIAPLVAAMKIVVAIMPNGDVERSTFSTTPDGVMASVERTTRGTDITIRRQQFLKPGRYTWKIEEDRKTILMAPPGRPTGVVRRTFSVAGWLDISQRATDPPRPVEVFKFYTPSREAADALVERLKQGLKT